MPCQLLETRQTFRRTCYLRLHCRTVSTLKNKVSRFIQSVRNQSTSFIRRAFSEDRSLDCFVINNKQLEYFSNQPTWCTKFLLYNMFISCLYMFRAPCAHRQEVKIVLYSSGIIILILFHASTCFEHHVLIVRRSKLYYTALVSSYLFYFMPLHVSSTMCSSSGGQNCIIQLWYHHTYRYDDTRAV